MRRVSAAAAVVLGLAACAPDVPPPSAFGCTYGGPCPDAAVASAPDARAPDAGVDAQIPVDAQPPVDAQAPDDAGLGHCQTSTTATCDDFEADMLRWSTVGGSSVHLTRARFHGGEQALEIAPPPARDATSIAQIRTATTVGDHDLHIRFWFQYAGAPDSGEILFNLLQVYAGASVVGQIRLTPTSLRTVGPQLTPDFAPGVRGDVWSCLEVAVVKTGTATGMRAWLHDQPVLSSAGPIPSNTFDLRLGMFLFVPSAQLQTTAIAVWIDDVVIDRTFIGCGP